MNEQQGAANRRRAEYILNHYSRRSLADIEILGRHLDQHDAEIIAKAESLRKMAPSHGQETP